jgi:hypothetical protein
MMVLLLLKYYIDNDAYFLRERERERMLRACIFGWYAFKYFRILFVELSTMERRSQVTFVKQYLH